MKKIRDKTHGDFKQGLTMLVLGPLESDVQSLRRALGGLEVDQQEILEVLLSRSNTDIQAIILEYGRCTGKDLRDGITATSNEFFFIIHRTALTTSRAEETEPVNSEDIDHKISDLFMAGGLSAPPSRAGAISTMQSLLSLNQAQIHVLNQIFLLKYQQNLDTFILRKTYPEDMTFWLRYLLMTGAGGAIAEAETLHLLMMVSPIRARLFIRRLLRVWWSGQDFGGVCAAYGNVYGRPIECHVKSRLSGDYQRLALALIGGMNLP